MSYTDRELIIIICGLTTGVCLCLVCICMCKFIRRQRYVNTQDPPIIGNIQNEFNISQNYNDQFNDIIFKEDQDIECTICLDTEYSSVIELSLCKHKFHKNCLKKLNFCPNCRLGINIV